MYVYQKQTPVRAKRRGDKLQLMPILHEWTREDGILCVLRENGNIEEVLMKGNVMGNPCQPGFRLVPDESYAAIVREYLQKKRVEKICHPSD